MALKDKLITNPQIIKLAEELYKAKKPIPFTMDPNVMHAADSNLDPREQLKIFNDSVKVDDTLANIQNSGVSIPSF